MDEELRNNFVTPILHFDVEAPNNSETLKTQEQLETNIRQRGNVGGSAKKVDLRIKELERIYGIKQGGHGSNQYVQNSNNFKSAKTQEDLAKELGITVQSINNYKKLTEIIPELEELVDTGIISQIPTNILTMYIKSNNIDI